jgi:hypothetical protein
MSSVLTSNQQTGGAQWQNAVANSQNAINALFRAAGVTGDTSGYSAANAVGGAAGAPALGTLTYGPEGGFSEAYQAGGNIAAEQASASRSRGLGRGGLAAQRQELALMQTQQGAAEVTRALTEGIGEQYGIVQQADAEEITRLANTAKASADAAAAAGSITNPEVTVPEVAAPPDPMAAIAPSTSGGIMPVGQRDEYKKKGTPGGGGVPKNPPLGQVFKGSGGVTWVYRNRPNGPGWYKR